MLPKRKIYIASIFEKWLYPFPFGEVRYEGFVKIGFKNPNFLFIEHATNLWFLQLFMTILYFTFFSLLELWKINFTGLVDICYMPPVIGW